jgi:hypothetical protein
MHEVYDSMRDYRLHMSDPSGPVLTNLRDGNDVVLARRALVMPQLHLNGPIDLRAVGTRFEISWHKQSGCAACCYNINFRGTCLRTSFETSHCLQSHHSKLSVKERKWQR